MLPRIDLLVPILSRLIDLPTLSHDSKFIYFYLCAVFNLWIDAFMERSIAEKFDFVRFA